MSTLLNSYIEKGLISQNLLKTAVPLCISHVLLPWTAYARFGSGGHVAVYDWRRVLLLSSFCV